MTTPKKETAQEKFQRLREKNKADMLEKMQKIETKQKAATFTKSQQKEEEEKAVAEETGEPVKKTEEKTAPGTERKVHVEEKTRVNPPKELEPLASHPPPSKFQRQPRNVRISDSEISAQRFIRMHESHQRCSNCCGGLPGRGPGSGRIGEDGHGCGAANRNNPDYEDYQGERLRGGADNGESTREKSPERFRGGCGGGCSPPPRPCSPPPCVHAPRNQSCPPPCCRSHRWRPPCQSQEPQRVGVRGNTKSNCPCGSCGGPGCQDNPGRGSEAGCCRRGPPGGTPCKCKCQSCKSFQPQGGCGGQSCGKMYSCSGSGGGASCFPRNYRRREGSECCGGTSPQHRSSCC
ncbi:keratin-associated protein 5-5 [Diachasma alloeum]|uniref:keratin-associated protein 5-5 n=1 Tax=Diachasma alloeum TaxID=454923 RepID=UPI00073834CF|nr:keratin-associated protein 5-5 [Diachasma alloeum]